MYKTFNEYVQKKESVKEALMPTGMSMPANGAQNQAQMGQQLNQMIQQMQSGQLSGDRAILAMNKLKTQSAVQDATFMKNKLLGTSGSAASTAPGVASG